jgi:hypothetical protein
MSSDLYLSPQHLITSTLVMSHNRAPQTAFTFQNPLPNSSFVPILIFHGGGMREGSMWTRHALVTAIAVMAGMASAKEKPATCT